MGFMDGLKKLTQPYDDDEDFFEGADQTTLESLVEAGKPFVAAKITASGQAYSAAVVGFEDFAALQAASLVRTFSLIPLYELKQPDQSGESEGESSEPPSPPPIVVVQDFRAMPLVQAFELPTEGGIA